MRRSAKGTIAAANLALVVGLLATVNTPATAQVTEYQFVDVTATAGVANSTQAHWGATWSDYDADGDIDLYVVNGANPPGGVEDENVLYRNNGDGSFTDVTAATGLGDPWIAMRNIWADYDRDGDLDMYSHNFDQSTLYQNNSNVFSDVNATSGAGVEMPKGTGAAWGDYDNDGWLDIHATGFPGWNVLLHNNGDGTFSDAQPTSGMSFSASGMGNVWGDYDMDGDVDMAITAVTSTDPTFLYRNNGDGTFTDITTDVGVIVEFGSSTAAANWADYDNDGDWDLHITEVDAGSIKTLPNRMYLFENQGDATFVDSTAAAGMTPTTMTDFWDAAFVDYDSDGDLDMYLAGNGPDVFYQNNGDGTFTDIALDVGFDVNNTTWGTVWGDYDDDGDMDHYLVRKQGPSANVLYENQGGSNNWLQLDLKGTVSNLDAIGAQITVVANGELMMREITGGSGFFSQHSLIQHFGLGQATTIDSVEIRWPSGIVQQVDGLTINERHVVVEAGSGPPIASFTAVDGAAPLSIDVDASGSIDDGTIVSYDWDFGDGNAGTGVTASHAYATAGTYPVTLTVTDDDSDTDTDTQDVTVTDPSAAIHIGDLDGVSGDDGRGWNATVTVTVHDSNELPVDGAVVDATWSDGAATAASCVADASGTCSMTSSRLRDSTLSTTLTVDAVTLGAVSYDSAANHDDEGDSDGTVIVVDQTAVGNTPPTASFTWSCTDLDCTFTDTSSDGDGSVVGWDWDFGDGTTSTLQNTSHSFATAGTYAVTLGVTDDEGATDAATNSITVPTGTGGGTMHVSDLDATSVSQGTSWLAIVTVSVVDDTGAAVDGATVSGTFRRGAIGACTTTASGACDVELLTSARGQSFDVDGISHASLTYDPAANSDPDGDSDGTTIVINAPA